MIHQGPIDRGTHDICQNWYPSVKVDDALINITRQTCCYLTAQKLGTIETDHSISCSSIRCYHHCTISDMTKKQL
jgi:hypothetical protein